MKIWWLFAAAFVLAQLVLYLYLSAPRTARRKECAEFTGLLYAHRGLWSAEKQIPENSLPAFQRAVDAGYAIEMDVQMTKDHRLVVFHDDTLRRMCRKEGRISSYTMEELRAFRLEDTPYGIPEFSEVLQLVDGKVPLLIEIKLPTKNTRTCVLLNRALHGYKGKYCIESFNSLALYWYRLHKPSVVRGQLSDRFKKSDGVNPVLRFLAGRLLLNWVGRPDFIAYNYRHANRLGVWLQRKLFRAPTFVWTVQSDDAYRSCNRNFDAVIFDGFLPSERCRKKKEAA